MVTDPDAWEQELPPPGKLAQVHEESINSVKSALVYDSNSNP